MKNKNGIFGWLGVIVLYIFLVQSHLLSFMGN